jgi:hypothetical protein
MLRKLVLFSMILTLVGTTIGCGVRQPPPVLLIGLAKLQPSPWRNLAFRMELIQYSKLLTTMALEPTR